MLNVRNIRVRSFDIDYLDIFWDIEPTYEDVCKYSFVIEKSYAEFGPFFDLTGEFRDKYRVRDNTLRSQHSHYTKHYYRVRVKNLETNDEVIYPTDGNGVTVTASPDLIALEMARVERLKLKEHKGRKVWVFPRKRFGQRCSCYDEVTKRKIRSSCVTCYDTGWVGGYDSPIETYAQIVTPPEDTLKTQLAEIEVKNGDAKFSNYPELFEGWIVVEQENIRWRIGSRINKVEKGRAVVRQEVQLHGIPRGDIEFSLPLNIEDIEILEATPQRNLTNPTSLETAFSGSNSLTFVNLFVETQPSGDAMSDGKVKVSTDDAAPGFLEDKIVGGDMIFTLVLNDGGDEDIQISFGGTLAELNTAITDANLLAAGVSSIDKGLVRFDGTTGSLIEDVGIRNYGSLATDPTTPAPSNGDLYFNTAIKMWMTYDSVRAKFLSTRAVTIPWGRGGNTAAGSYFRGAGNIHFTSTRGRYVENAGTVTAISYTRDDSDAATFEVTRDGVGFAEIASAATEGEDLTLNADFATMGVLGVRNKTGGNTVNDAHGYVTIRWRA